MTVKELIQLLHQAPQDAVVLVPSSENGQLLSVCHEIVAHKIQFLNAEFSVVFLPDGIQDIPSAVVDRDEIMRVAVKGQG